MATYKPIRKTASGTEEIKIPYAVLADPPTIPAAVTESTVSGWGFTKNAGTITGIKMNGSSKGTSGVVDLGTVITADGGTINKSKTVKMDASANSNGANLKWGTVNSKNPYIGYASDQVDGTFVVGSLLGTNYASGLAIGGGSGNLLWKGTKVATTSDIPAAVTESTVSGWGFTKNTGTVTSVAVKMNGATKGTVTSSGTIDLGTVLSEEDVKDIKVNNATNADTAGKVANPFTILSSPSGSSIYETFLAYDGSAHKSFMFGTDFWVDQTGTPTVFLNNSGVTAGTYNSVTVDKKGRVTAGTNTPAVDTSNLAKLDTENTFTKGQVITGSTSGGYSINASGYVKGSWLQSGVKSNYGSGTGMVCVFDGSGWIYYRTPSEILSEASGVPKSAFSLSGTTLTITI